MKYLLYTLLIIALYSCTSRNENWFIWKQGDNDKTEKIIRANISLFNFLREDLIDDYFENFHVIDIDNDNDLDIIYHGWIGAESKLIECYLNKNGKYLKSISTWGNLNTVTENETDNFIMDVNLPGCCGDYEIRDYKIETIVKKDSLNLKCNEIKIRHGDTKKPKKMFDSPINFKVVNDSYYLRVTPEIDSTNYFFPGEGPPGNIYLKYKTGDKGIAYGEKTDETGRVWWYVEMEQNKNHSRQGINDSIVYPKFIGWMSSRFIKKISGK